MLPNSIPYQAYRIKIYKRANGSHTSQVEERNYFPNNVPLASPKDKLAGKIYKNVHPFY